MPVIIQANHKKSIFNSNQVELWSRCEHSRFRKARSAAGKEKTALGAAVATMWKWMNRDYIWNQQLESSAIMCRLPKDAHLLKLHIDAGSGRMYCTKTFIVLLGMPYFLYAEKAERNVKYLQSKVAQKRVIFKCI